MGCCLLSCIELDTTEATQQQQHLFQNAYYTNIKQKDKKKKKEGEERKFANSEEKTEFGALLVTV